MRNSIFYQRFFVGCWLKHNQYFVTVNREKVASFEASQREIEFLCTVEITSLAEYTLFS